MSTLQELVGEALERTAEAFTPLDPEVAARLRALAATVDEPCVVAVAGRVKAGKSSIVNALLGQEHAVVGTLEATATINHFVHGEPEDRNLPIKCFWADGSSSNEGEEFLNCLQGHDLEALHKSAQLRRAEYHLPIAFLRQVTLVDTPGTGAVVDQHQNRTAEFLRLEHQLRARREQESLEDQNGADAVIYVIGPIAKESDRALLEELRQATSGQERAANVVGVIAKADLSHRRLHDADGFAADIRARLGDEIGAVVSVSAGLEQVHRRLAADGDALAAFVALARRLPADRLDKLLDNEDLYWDLDYDLAESERSRLRGFARDWSVFTAAVRVAADGDAAPEAVLDRIYALSGFRSLLRILEAQFFSRAHVLRCYRIVQDAQTVLNQARYRRLHTVAAAARQAQERLDNFERLVGFVPGHDAMKADLSEFLKPILQIKIEAPRQWSQALDAGDRALEEVGLHLDDCNSEFALLQELQDEATLFEREERQELEALFGRYGLEAEARLGGADPADLDGIRARQSTWARRMHADPSQRRRAYARAAEYRYGLLGAQARTAGPGEA